MSKITVIIPVYNKLHLFEKCLLSICHQSRLPDEIIVSDDGSSKDVLGVLKKFEFPCPVKLIRQQDLGFRLARCRNNAVRNATGTFLIFADQDIVYTKNYIRRCDELRRQSEFLTPYPVRLSEAQSKKVTNQIINDSQYDSIIEHSQLAKLKKQYQSERIYSILFRLKLRLMGPKLRGGLLAIHTDDYIRVNGFDEKFIGWGNEDDDMGRRLHKAGIIGRNAFIDEYPIHLWHPPHHVDGERVNKEYTIKRKSQIRKGDFRAEFGFDQTFGDDPVDIIEIS